LSEQLDALRHVLLCDAHLPPTVAADGHTWPQLPFSMETSMSPLLPTSEEGPESLGSPRTPSSGEETLYWPHTLHHPFAGSWEEILALVQSHQQWNNPQILQESEHRAPEYASPALMERIIYELSTMCPQLRANLEEPLLPELIQGDPLESLPTEPHLHEDAVSATHQPSELAQPTPSLAPCMPSSTAGEHKTGHLALTTVEQAIAVYVQEMRATGRAPKTLRWHQTSLSALRRSLQRQFHLRDECFFSGDSLRTWLTELSIAPSTRTGATRSASTVATYARSAHAFCNWLVGQGYVSETPFPQD
jgi:hypothetical protein